jgi:hypothetical protein
MLHYNTNLQLPQPQKLEIVNKNNRSSLLKTVPTSPPPTKPYKPPTSIFKQSAQGLRGMKKS